MWLRNVEMRLRAVRPVRAASRKGESKPRPPRVQRGIQRLGKNLFRASFAVPVHKRPPSEALWARPMMTPNPTNFAGDSTIIDMPARGVQRRKQGRSYAPRHPHCAPKEATRPCSAKRSPRSSLSSKNPRNRGLAGGSVPFLIRKWGAAPLKKRLGYRETASSQARRTT